MTAITIDTDATGQLTIDMPAGADRSRLISTLKSGKYGPAGRDANAHVTYASLAAAYRAAAAGARVNGDAAAAAAHDASAARMVESAAIVASMGAIRPAAAAAGKDARTYTPGGEAQREPISDADLIGTYAALGNRWGANVYRSSRALDGAVKGQATLWDDAPADVPAAPMTGRKLTPADVKTLTAKLPAVHVITYAAAPAPRVAPESLPNYGPRGTVPAIIHDTVRAAIGADQTDRAERVAAEYAARRAAERARYAADDAKRVTVTSAAPAPVKRKDDGPRCPAAYCGNRIRVLKSGLIGAHKHDGRTCPMGGTVYVAPAAPAEPVAAPAPVAEALAATVIDAPAVTVAPAVSYGSAIAMEAAMTAAYAPMMHVHEIGADVDCLPHTGRSGPSFYRHTLAANADAVTCPVCRFLNHLDDADALAAAEPVAADDAPAEPVAEAPTATVIDVPAEPVAAAEPASVMHVWARGSVAHTWCRLPHPLPAGHAGMGAGTGSPFRNVVHGGPVVTVASLVTCPGCSHVLTCTAAGCGECERVTGAPIPAPAAAPVAKLTSDAHPAPAETAQTGVTDMPATVTTTAPVAPAAAPVAPVTPAPVAAAAAPARVAVRDRGEVDGYAFTIKRGGVNRATLKTIKSTVYAERDALGGVFNFVSGERGTVAIVPAPDVDAPADWSPVLARVAALLGDALA